MPNTFSPHGKHFEDFTLGDVATSAGRTITETDNVNFAGLSGDFTQLHTNVEAARQGPFGQRVAHGLLGLAVANALVHLQMLGVTAATARPWPAPSSIGAMPCSTPQPRTPIPDRISSAWPRR